MSVFIALNFKPLKKVTLLKLVNSNILQGVAIVALGNT